MAKGLDGLEQMVAKLHRVRNVALAGMLDGGEKAGEHVLGVSNDHVPHEEGTLERSGKVEAAVHSGQTRVLVGIGYDTKYAVTQHEDMTLKHDPGRTAKFLENAMNSERKTVQKLVAASVRDFLKKGV